MRFPAYPNQGRTIREYDLATAADFTEGAFVVIAAGEVDECGANPAEILGVALHASGVLPFDGEEHGYSFEGKVLVAVAKSKSTFIMQGSAAPAATDEGVAYGITKDADDVWYVDKAKTGANARVIVERVFVGRNRDQYEVSILPANRQMD